MAGFTFLHCADLHLGAPVRGLGKMPRRLRDRLRDAPYEALTRIVTAAIERHVAAVVIAGDVYDSEDRNLRAQVQLRDQLRRLDEECIPVFIAAGNHDPLGSIGSGISLPPSVYVFGEEVEGVPVLAEGDEIARVYGVSYWKSATYKNLAAEFPSKPEGPFNIGVLHASVGDRTGHAPYAPCRLDELVDSAYDYWALGHVHTRETLHAQRPIVHYPGNPQGLHTREPGARGATLVRVEPGGRISLEPLWTDVVRWHRERTSIEGTESIDEIVGAYGELAGTLRGAAPNRVHLVRWTLTGHSPLHAELARPGAEAELRDALRASEGVRAEGDPVWLERIDLATSPARDMERMRSQQDYLGDMLRLAAALSDRPPAGAHPEIGDERPLESEDVPATVREALAELLDSSRLARAIGGDPWQTLQWKELLARAEAMAVEHLAPAEAD